MNKLFLAALARLALITTLLAAMAAGTAAHPHIFIDSRADIHFDDAGAITSVRHHWTFDEGFSAWAIQGLDENGDGRYSGEELAELAVENTTGLEQFSYYTFIKSPLADNGFTGVLDPAMALVEGKLTLSFTLPLARPVDVADAFELEVGDPEYYVAFAFPENDAVRLLDAPDACVAAAAAPQPIDPEIEARLWDLGAEVTELPDDLKAAARSLTNHLTITCGGPATALAATQGQSRGGNATAFTAPPSDPSLLPNSGGVFGWIRQVQQTFYRSLTGTLSAIRDDGSAFWVLSGLAFAYGVFHAAGPGHGKIIISSYVVAREREWGRGVALSFAAAMMQSAVAVGFILVAAGLLRLTSLAMEDTARWMAVGSYALIVLLGVWLVWRKVAGLFGGGGHDRHHGHHGGDDYSHHHHHVVGPTGRASLAEMAGVVTSVGLRPCSGALILLAFALSQGLLLAGIVATFVMGVGTALTVAVLAGLAVLFKGWAERAAGKGGRWPGLLLGVVELLGALAVFAFGLILLFASL